MTKEEFAEKLVEIFPEKKEKLSQHYDEYGKLLGHVFFGDEINLQLSELLSENTDNLLIKTYCKFVEDMWNKGNDEVRNIVEVTICEYISDNTELWKRFGNYISDNFKNDINIAIIPVISTAPPKL